MFFPEPEPDEDGIGRERRDYWEAQLSEYWDSGLTIQEYSELKELPYESTRRWIRVLQKARQDDVDTFLSTGAISLAQHDKSLNCLIEKMGIGEENR